MRPAWLLVILGIIIYLMVLGGVLYSVLTFEETIKEVPCYDRFSNEIKELTCTEEYTKDELHNDLFVFILIGIVFGTIPLIVGISSLKYS